MIKKIIYFLLFILFFLLLIIQQKLTFANEVDYVNISFNDNKLYLALVEELTDKYEFNIGEDDSITISSSEIAKIKELTLDERRISDISGLECFTSLEKLDLSNNSITNISLLFSLQNLKELYLAHNKISKINNINSLSSLEYLDLYGNNISNLDGLSNMNSLIHLDLGYNNTDKTKVIENLNVINTLSNLTYLDFSYNYSSEISNNISNLVNLEYLNVQNNYIVNIESIQNLTNLKELYIHNNLINDISPILNLPLLEVIYLRANQLSNLSGIVVNNHLVWEHARIISINNITRLKDNSFEVEFLRNMARNKEIELGYSNIFDTSNLPHVDSNGIQYVTYEDFGARCDGIYDDSLAMREAHNFANDNGYEVRASANKIYHIYNYYEDRISIRTNTDWNNATFIIHDEEIEHKSNRLSSLFVVEKLTNDNLNINNPNVVINKNTKKLIGLESELSSLNAKGYKKYYVNVYNANKMQFIRGTYNSYTEGYEQFDCFQIDSEGNLLNDVQWDFDEVTSITIMPIQEKTIKIKNATFISNPFNANHSGSPKEFYYRGINFNNSSNIEVSNITHTLSEDKISSGYFGFLFIYNCSDMKFTNINLFARKQRVSTVDKIASYELKLERSTNILFDNINSNGINDFDRWGFMASAYSKDIVFKNARVNRIDAHEGIYNLTVLDSYVGYHGFTVVGQGVFRAENTTVESEQFVTFRWDYGSFWNGDFYVKNCTHKYQGKYAFKFANIFIEYNEGEGLHNFGYETHLPNMYLDNFYVESYKNQIYYFIGNFDDKRTEYALPSYWPKVIKNNGFNYKIENNRNINFRFLYSQNNDINGNYSFISLKLFNGNNDITDKFNKGISINTTENVTLEMTKNVLASNKINVYKNNQKIIDNKTIDEDYSYVFKEVGNYSIQVESEEPKYSKKGKIVYEFNIYTNDKILNENNSRIDKSKVTEYRIETNIDLNELNSSYSIYIDNKLLKLGSDYTISNQNIVLSKSIISFLSNGKHQLKLKNDSKGIELINSFEIYENKIDTDTNNNNKSNSTDNSNNTEQSTDNTNNSTNNSINNSTNNSANNSTNNSTNNSINNSTNTEKITDNNGSTNNTSNNIDNKQETKTEDELENKDQLDEKENNNKFKIIIVIISSIINICILVFLIKRLFVKK